MGLLDSVLSAVTNNAQGSGGLQDLIGMVAQNPKLLEVVGGLGNAGNLIGTLGSLLQR